MDCMNKLGNKIFPNSLFLQKEWIKQNEIIYSAIMYWVAMISIVGALMVLLILSSTTGQAWKYIFIIPSLYGLIWFYKQDKLSS